MARRKRLNEFFAQETARAAPRDREQVKPRPECIQREEAEVIAKMAAEKVLAILGGRIIESLEKCVEKLDILERRVESLEKAILRYGTGPGSPGRSAREPLQVSGRKTRRGRSAEKLEEYLERHRFLLLSESRQKLGLPPGRAREAADEIGAVQLELSGDIAILLPEHLEEYDALLAGARTPDPLEAARRLGPYARLFEKMRRDGLVYYDAGKGHWRRLD